MKPRLAWAAVTGARYTGHLQLWNAFWGQRYAVVHDSDGTTVDLYANVRVVSSPER